MVLLERRVKIYKLVNNVWEDQGTGICNCIPFDELTNKLMFVIYSEENSKVIFSSKISHLHLYQKEQGTLLIWSESNEGPNICLSFQVEEGRDEAYRCIIEAQTRLNLPTSPPAPREESPAQPQPSLPHPTLDNLGSILLEFDTIIRNNYPRDSVFQLLQQSDFFGGLASVYKSATEHSQVSALFSLNRIVKALLTMGDSRVIDIIIKDDLVLVMAGILENDPELPEVYLGYREYLEDASRFRQVIEIPDETIRRKVHESFRLSYFKETILSRTTDEMLINRFASAISQRNSEIFFYLTSHAEYLSRVFALLDDPESPTSIKRDVILFTHHLCSLFKTVGAHAVLPLLRIISQRGLFLIFRALLLDDDIKVRSMGMEIVMLVVDQDPVNVRNYIRIQLQNNSTPSFLSLLVQSLVTESSSSVSSQYADLIRSLLFGQNQMLPKMGVPSTMLMPDMLGTGVRRRCPDQEFLSMEFYDHFIEPLCVPILSLEFKPVNSDSAEPKTFELSKKQEIVCNTVCELLISCLRYQTTRIKHFLITSNIVPKMGLLLRSRYNQMKLTALRFLRVMIGTKDEDFQKLVLKHKLLPEVFDFYLSSESADNLLNSAGLEFFDFIAKNNLVLLINYLVDNLGTEISSIKGTKVFSQIHQRYITAQEGTGETTEAYSGNRTPNTVPNSPAQPQNRAWHSSTLDNDEEKYFDLDYDEDEEKEREPNSPSSPNSSATPVLNGNHSIQDLPSRPKSLVDYDEEDEDALLALSKNSKNVVAPIKKKLKIFCPVIKSKPILERSESVLNLNHKLDPVTSLVPSNVKSNLKLKRQVPEPSNSESSSDIAIAEEYLQICKVAQPKNSTLLNVQPSQNGDLVRKRKALSQEDPVVSSLSLAQNDLDYDSVSDDGDSGSLSPSLRLESPDFTETQKEKILHYEEQESMVPADSDPSNHIDTLHDDVAASTNSPANGLKSDDCSMPEKRLKLSDPQDLKENARKSTPSPDTLSIQKSTRSSTITEP